MPVIFKYQFTTSRTEFSLLMPKGAHILTVQMQGVVVPTLWAIVDPIQPPEQINFEVVGTGWERPEIDPAKYVGTIQEGGGNLVWHIFRKN